MPNNSVIFLDAFLGLPSFLFIRTKGSWLRNWSKALPCLESSNSMMIFIAHLRWFVEWTLNIGNVLCQYLYLSPWISRAFHSNARHHWFFIGSSKFNVHPSIKGISPRRLCSPFRAERISCAMGPGRYPGLYCFAALRHRICRVSCIEANRLKILPGHAPADGSLINAAGVSQHSPGSQSAPRKWGRTLHEPWKGSTKEFSQKVNLGTGIAMSHASIAG